MTREEADKVALGHAIAFGAVSWVIASENGGDLQKTEAALLPLVAVFIKDICEVARKVQIGPSGAELN